MAPVKQLMATGLGYSFGPAKILRDIDLTVGYGETVAVVGPSGGGKSTLLRLCAGLLEVDIGNVHSSFQRHSFAFQDPRLLPWQMAAPVRLLPTYHPRGHRAFTVRHAGANTS